MKRFAYDKTEAEIMERSDIPFGIYQFVGGRVLTVLLSDGFIDLFGFDNRDTAVKAMDSDMYRDAYPDDVARVAEAALRFATEGDRYDVIYRSMKKGEYHIIHAYGKHIYPEEGVRLGLVWYADEGVYVSGEVGRGDLLAEHYSGSLYENALHRKNNYDFLTGLPNMTYFFDLARNSRDDAFERGAECYLGFANLNGMKYFNQKHGFAEGDKVLRGFADLLVKHFGSENSCRIGQDNFAFFYEGKGLEDVLYDLFDEVDEESGEKNITVRVGVYPSTMGMVDTSTACDRARYACNLQRKSNASCFKVFNESMLKYENNRQYIIDNLDRALRENRIQAYYQPIVRAANGRVCDEEALARWIDPEKGMLSPADFIPILEDAKLIYKVDLHMVDEIIMRIKRQQKQGLHVVPISVNLSRTDFDMVDMVEEITDRLDAAGVDRKFLTIEITESVIGSDVDFMRKQIERFMNLGYSVWMDDFGSGYSSLDILQTMHFDLIKLDMSFMKQFNNGDRCKIIVTELMKMAAGLGIETVTEGVETEEQVEFLREVGCTKLQGYYYCKPIPYEEIVKRNEEGRQIGFENPAESGYFESVGKINLYDLSAAASDDSDSFDQYFNTLPMAVIEAGEQGIKVLRSNRSYRDFLKVVFGVPTVSKEVNYDDLTDPANVSFVKAIKRCVDGEGDKELLNEKIGGNSTLHAFIKKIATNPVTGLSACIVVILGISKNTDKGISYADVANSLSADYMYLYYVDLNTESFVEYRPDTANRDLTVERRGDNFFEQSRKDALDLLHKDDAVNFISVFNKENVLQTIDTKGSFTVIYRLLMGDSALHVSMKAMRMSGDADHLIIGVNNVENQMKQQEMIDRMRMEQMAYSRIAVLSGGLIVLYSVDMDTDSYIEYSSTKDYENFGFAKRGEDFFGKTLAGSVRSIYPEDLERFNRLFNKENILKELEKNSVFMLNYRLMLEGKPTYVGLRAAFIEENGGRQLIVGINNIDSQVRRDLNLEL